MEEAATETVYDNESPMFEKQLRIKVNGTYETCSLQVIETNEFIVIFLWLYDGWLFSKKKKN
jgi:hypothetical protein